MSHRNEVEMLPTSFDTALMHGLDDNGSKQVRYRELTAQPSYRPVVVEGDDTPQPVSKYFGLPWLEEGENWPEINGKKLTFVLQLDVASLPAAQASMLGGSGLVQLFYETTGAEEPETSALVRLVHPQGFVSSARASDLDPYDNPDWKMKLIAGWEEHVDYARFEHFMSLFGKELGNRDPFVNECFGVDEDCIQGDKLGGWPFWAQGVWPPKDRSGTAMLPVMQLDAGCFFKGRQFPANAPELFAGEGTGHVFVSMTDPCELKFAWACG